MSITNEDLFKLINEGNASIKKEIGDLRAEITSEISILKLKNEELEKENKQLKNKILEIERKSKKYNIVIYGIQGDELNTVEEVLRTINNELNISCTKNDFRDIYRIGQNVEGKYRPVVVELLSYNLKADILMKARSKSKELKARRIYFGQEYTTEEYQKRKFLGQQLKAARNKQYNATIKKGILIINGEEYTYEYLKEKEKKCTNNTPDKESAETNNEPVEVLRKTTSNPATPSIYNEDIFSFPSPQQRSRDEKKRKLEISPSKPTGTKPKIATRAQGKTRTNIL